MNISKQAIIHPDATLAENVTVGPFTTIGANASIGEGTEIASHAVIEAGTVIGKNCRVFHGASLGGDPQIIGFGDVPSTVRIGDDTTIREFVTVHRSGVEHGVTEVGNHCMLMAYSHVAHDCKVGNYVTIVNYTGLAGHIEVEDYAFISGLVGLHQFIRIGRDAMVGGMSGVNKDVLPFSMVAGNPARLLSTNAVGLKRRNFKPKIRSAIKAAIKLIRSPELNGAQAIERIESEIEMCEEILYLVDFIKNSKRGISV